ncbi:MAG: hypothetical protein ACR2RV_02700 [Verrucomicrobiales bacterium]
MPEDDPTPPATSSSTDSSELKDLNDPRLEFQNPFRGSRGTYHRIMQPFRMIFYFPLFLNIKEAMRIVDEGHGHTWGAEKIMFIFPLIPVTIILLLISAFQQLVWGEINPSFSLVAQMIWILLLCLCVWSIGDDIDGKLVGAAIGVVVAIAGIFIALQLTGTLNIIGKIGDFISWISPKFEPGTAILTTILFSGMYIKSFIKTRIHQTLTTSGNRWNPSRIATDASYDSGFHRLYSTTPDWLERAFFKSRSICICSSQDHVRKDDDEIEKKAVYMLPNVAGASTVIAAMEYAASRLDIEK